MCCLHLQAREIIERGHHICQIFLSLVHQLCLFLIQFNYCAFMFHQIFQFSSSTVLIFNLVQLLCFYVLLDIFSLVHQLCSFLIQFNYCAFMFYNMYVLCFLCMSVLMLLLLFTCMSVLKALQNLCCMFLYSDFK